MKDFKYLVYDDNANDCLKLKKLLLEACGNKTDVFVAETVDEAKRLLENNITVAFLDIELENKKNGIDFACYINKNYPDVKIVFVTAHIWYSEEVFVSDYEGFIVKPISMDKLSRILDYIKGRVKSNSDDYIIARTSKTGSAKIFLNNIIYLETSGRKVYFYGRENSRIYTVTEKLSDLAARLPSYFLRCHHSFCLNMNYVSEIKRYEALLCTGLTLPVSQNRYKDSKQKFMCFLGSDV